MPRSDNVRVVHETPCGFPDLRTWTAVHMMSALVNAVPFDLYQDNVIGPKTAFAIARFAVELADLLIDELDKTDGGQ